MEVNKIYEGTCLDVIRTFPDKSIDCVITSPPYWQLRDYGWSGQWGMEKTFNEYLGHLWELMDEIWRVLKDTGTVWINLGDTYSGSQGFGWKQSVANDNQSTNGVNGNRNYRKETGRVDIEQNKCLLLIPHRFAIGCIDRGWIMRNDIIWAKRNGMPESMTDRFTKKHEYFFFMVKNEKYYFDLDGIRDNHKTASIERYKYEFNGNPDGLDRQQSGRPQGRALTKYTEDGGRPNWTGEKSTEGHINGKNPGSVSDFWDIPTKPNKDKHFASYNTALIDKHIVAGCPVGGIILDPFCGTATTGCRAIDLQRKFIGIEGSSEYVKIGNKKLLPFQITQQLF